MAALGGAPKCPKCTKSVYMAEEVKVSGKSYHKLCFSCKICRKSLESTTVTEHEGGIYCKACYAKNFGPKGYGYGVGAGALAHTGKDALSEALATPAYGEPAPGSPKLSPRAAPAAVAEPEKESTYSEAAPAAEGTLGEKPIGQRGYQPTVPQINPANGADRCAKCEKPVYLAERAIGAGRTWHKKCFICTTCNRSLDSSTLQDKDNQLFCNTCYKKNFGPKGFRGGVSGGMEHTS